MEQEQQANQPTKITRPSFLLTLFRPDDIIEIRKIGTNGPRGSEWYLAKELSLQYVRLSAENQNNKTAIYFGVNPRSAKGLKDSAGVKLCRVFCADIDQHEGQVDEKDFRSKLSASGLPYPSAIVFSGHGYQCYWIVSGGEMTPDVWMEGQKSIIKAFNGSLGEGPADHRIKDLPRVMRLSGFRNWRDPENPVVAKVLEINDKVYPVTKFVSRPVMSLPDRARRYLESIPGAVQGQGGDAHTFTVACRLVNDFSLSEGEAWPLLLEWNSKCQPAWNEEELRQKLINAGKYHNAPSGQLAGQTTKPTFQRSNGSDRRAPKFDMEKMSDISKTCHLIIGKSLIWDDKRGLLLKPDSFRLLYNSEGSAWLKSPSKQLLLEENLVFEPGGCKPDQVNLFKGFRIKPAPGPSDLIKAHILHLCGGDIDLAQWMTSWMAYPLQHPGAKLQTALIIHGTFGTGKNLLFDAYSRLFDPYSIALNQQILDGRFTDWMSRKCFILADEVIANASQGAVKNRLKAMVTSDWFTIEEKNLPCRQERNHSNMVFLSNNDMPLIMDLKDRRYVVIRCDSVREPDYYVALAQQISNLPAFLDFLLSHDCGEFHEHSKPPDTEAKRELIELCRPSHSKFIELWQNGYLPFTRRSIYAHQLYFVYRLWCERAGEKGFVVSEKRFCGEAIRILKNHKTTAGRVYDGEKYGFIEDGEISNYKANTMQEKL